ncbi:MAG: 5-(carboxyamino)imidazole ribonucleotide mutase [Mariprofundaceae bacterium]
MEALKVLILMGSKSDLPVMEKAIAVLDEYAVAHKVLIRSAHRTPEATIQTVKDAEASGCQVFICAAGMAAHLAGAVAAHTTRPVIGVPIAAGPLNGQDALLSTVMMPPGIPVATVGINGAKNAALLSLQILALGDQGLQKSMIHDRHQQAIPKD